ncbi:MAG TPA: 30S ribosomal protein S6 [Candidatus Binatia bacterium]|nr:30S ribosomal protein S6 [Candidatus Binatia bacterium]
MADRRYETLVLIHPEQGEPGSKEITARIRTLVEEQGCPIGQVQEWGLRELSYPVAKQRRGFYVLFEYRATTTALQEIERNLKLMDPVLRFVSVRQEENAPPTPPRTVRRAEREEVEEAGGGEAELGDGEGM